jgi:hypothetical protein
LAYLCPTINVIRNDTLVAARKGRS